MMLRGEQEKEEIVVWGLPMGQEAGLENSVRKHANDNT